MSRRDAHPRALALVCLASMFIGLSIAFAVLGRPALAVGMAAFAAVLALIVVAHIVRVLRSRS